MIMFVFKKHENIREKWSDLEPEPHKNRPAPQHCFLPTTPKS
jgi:hypothetical protein